MYRRRVNKRIDKRIFSYTADRTKAVNVNPPIFRGGIRF